MPFEITLLVLRLASAGFIVLLVGALLIMIWRDYRAAVSQAAASKRSHGFLIAMREVDGSLVLTGEIYPLLPLTTLGRAPTNTIRVLDDFSSSEHARIARRNGQWWLEDRKSRNGTTLNHAPVAQPTVITNGDVIGIGSLHFRVDLEN